jgi:hypothetical protein
VARFGYRGEREKKEKRFDLLYIDTEYSQDKHIQDSDSGLDKLLKTWTCKTFGVLKSLILVHREI